MPRTSALLRRVIRALLPPLLANALRTLAMRRERPEWEYVPTGWDGARSDSRIKGWDVEGVLTSYKAKWPDFTTSIRGTAPFGLPPDATDSNNVDLYFHNSVMSFAYALTMSARFTSSISMLDWGGGFGHYLLIARALVPGLHIDYHCKDVPLLATHGQSLFPEAHFYTDEACLSRRYDLVMASTSLHYSPDWRHVLLGLADAADGYLFVTALPTVRRVPSFVFVQRPYAFGYDTEYLGWCLNQTEFLHIAYSGGLELVREFVIGHRPPIKDAPEQCEYRGFLFKPRSTA